MPGDLPTSDARRIGESIFQELDTSGAMLLISATVQRAKALIEPEIVSCPSTTGIYDEFTGFKIALISYPIHVKTRDGGSFPRAVHNSESIEIYETHSEHFDICVGNPKRMNVLEKWSSQIVKDCKYALEAGAKFVVIHELGYPSFCPGLVPSKVNRTVQKKLATLKRSLNATLQKLSNKHKAIIIAGTYHDWKTFENIAHIFFPAAETSYEHKKLTSAYKVHEHIKVARGAKYPIYEIGKKLRFCVLVCTDAFDLNIFFRQIMYRKTGDVTFAPQIYFVPSFYVPKPHQHSLLNACQQLSAATGSTVVFTNQAADPLGRAVFVSGSKIELVEDQPCFFAEISPERILAYQAQNFHMRTILNSIIAKNWTTAEVLKF